MLTRLLKLMDVSLPRSGQGDNTRAGQPFCLALAPIGCEVCVGLMPTQAWDCLRGRGDRIDQCLIQGEGGVSCSQRRQALGFNEMLLVGMPFLQTSLRELRLFECK